MIKMIIAIVMSVSYHTALKKFYLLIVLLKGTKFFTFNLKELRLSDCFNSTGTKSDNDSVPWYTGYT